MMTTIADTARILRDEHGMSYDEALTVATTYASQLGVDIGTQEGGQSPRVEIAPETAEHIVAAARADAENENRLSGTMPDSVIMALARFLVVEDNGADAPDFLAAFACRDDAEAFARVAIGWGTPRVVQPARPCVIRATYGDVPPFRESPLFVQRGE